jgi:hypothetical protein
MTCAPDSSSCTNVGGVAPRRHLAAGRLRADDALAVGYTGVAGVTGLAWESPIGGPPALLANSPLGSNRAWAMRMRFVDDTLQPFAVVPPSPLPLPNSGCVGLFPDLVLGDQIGWRALATASTGDLAALLIGTPLSLFAQALSFKGGSQLVLTTSCRTQL